jgi:hypothetical protein
MTLSRATTVRPRRRSRSPPSPQPGCVPNARLIASDGFLPAPLRQAASKCSCPSAVRAARATVPIRFCSTGSGVSSTSARIASLAPSRLAACSTSPLWSATSAQAPRTHRARRPSLPEEPDAQDGAGYRARREATLGLMTTAATSTQGEAGTGASASCQSHRTLGCLRRGRPPAQAKFPYEEFLLPGLHSARERAIRDETRHERHPAGSFYSRGANSTATISVAFPIQPDKLDQARRWDRRRWVHEERSLPSRTGA